MDTIWQDIRHGARVLLKNPGFTIVAVLTLALGIGANAAIFSVVNAFLLRPLPVREPDQLMAVANSHPENQEPHRISYLDYLDYSAQSDAFTDLAATKMDFLGISADGHADRVFAAFVTGNYFSMLGVQPALGRLLLPGEGKTPGTDPVVVLGNEYWRKHFGGDPSVVGKAVTVNGHPCTIVGVVDATFHGTFSLADTQAYLPFGMASIDPLSKDTFTKRDDHGQIVWGRLKPGVSPQAAQASLQVIAKNLEQQYPASNKGIRMYVIPEHLARPEPQSAGQAPVVASVFLGLVGLVLLVACVNVVNLLLSRATGRSKELAIRAALGAGRMRLVRQMLTECVLLSLVGGVAGAAAGIWTSRMLGNIQLPGDIPFRLDFSFDWRVFAYSAAIALVAGLIAGLVPALRASRTDVHDAVREGGRGNTGDGHHRLRDALVVAQVAGCLVLLVAAGLFVRSLNNARGVELGFQPDHLLILSMDPAQQGYDEVRGREFFKQVEDRARALPGVESATTSFTYPMNYDNQNAYIRLEGQTPEEGKRNPVALYNDVGSSYFETMKTRVLRGRALALADQDSPVRVAVVNETMARKLWPGADPIGKRFFYDGAEGKPIEVVGVAKDGKYGWMFEDPTPYFYMPVGQDYRSERVLQIRTAGTPQDLALTTMKEIHEIDPNLPVYDVMTMEHAMGGGNAFFLLNIGAGLAAALGGLGLVLAVIGVYGVVAYAASRRTNEIGIRMALGASRGNILRMVLRQGFGVVLVGIGVGVLTALGLARFLANMLFGIQPTDPLTFSVVTVVLAVAAIVACYLPARRATRVDPLVALRYE